MLGEQNLRRQRQHASKPHASQVERTQGLEPRRPSGAAEKPSSSPTARTASRTSGGMGSTARVCGMARFCSTVNCSTSTVRSLSSAKRRSDSSQSLAVGDVGRGAAEHPHLAFVGQARSGQQVDQHFGGRLVEAVERHGVPARQLPVAQPQGPQRVVVLDHARDVDQHIVGERRSSRPVPVSRGPQPLPLRRRQRHRADASAARPDRRGNRCRRSSARRARRPSPDSATPGRRRGPNERPPAHPGRRPPFLESPRRCGSGPDGPSRAGRPRRARWRSTAAGDGPTRSTNAGRPSASHESKAACTVFA